MLAYKQPQQLRRDVLTDGAASWKLDATFYNWTHAELLIFNQRISSSKLDSDFKEGEGISFLLLKAGVWESHFPSIPHKTQGSHAKDFMQGIAQPDQLDDFKKANKINTK